MRDLFVAHRGKCPLSTTFSPKKRIPGEEQLPPDFHKPGHDRNEPAKYVFTPRFPG
ncbi:MAG: hypothetical protein KAJ00_07160 [Deltaproteobacteria bacterium]|nr:hypothetical protein [Deltaproteobacteria bacterium]